MMKNKVVRLTVFLLLVTGISGLAVGYVNGITAPVIGIQEEKKLLQGYGEVYPDAEYGEPERDEGMDGMIDSLVVARKDGAEAGAIYTVVPKGYGGEIKMLVGFSVAEGNITGIKILSQAETPGLGGNCAQPWFAQRFAGKNADGKLAAVKTETTEAGEVQAITAATVTSTAVVAGINAAGADFAARFGGR